MQAQMESRSLNSVANTLPLDEIKLPQYEDVELDELETMEALHHGRRKKALRLGFRVESVQLTDQERMEALRVGRGRKQGRINEQLYAKKVCRPKEVVHYDAKQLSKIILDTANRKIQHLRGNENATYELNEYNRSILWKLCQYFAGDPEFEQGNLSLMKGICLVGPVGCGKTFMMKLFQQNQKQSYIVVGAPHIGHEFARGGFDVIDHYCKPLYAAENSFGHSEFGVCFDDLGADEKRKHYGDQVNALGDIIEGRYRWGRHYMTHLTTNLDGEQLEDTYGIRLRSRIREMFNVLMFDLSAPDLRK